MLQNENELSEIFMNLQKNGLFQKKIYNERHSVIDSDENFSKSLGTKRSGRVKLRSLDQNIFRTFIPL